jgi:hypothetical protein
MVGRDRTHEHLLAVFLLGVLLLLPPFLEIFNRPMSILGVPALYLYLFLTWATLIGLTAAVTRRIDIAQSNRGGTGDAPPDGLHPPQGQRDA